MTLKRMIEMALQTIGVLGEGREASAGQISEALDYFNAMLGSWSIDGLLVPYISRTSFTLPTKQTVTVGPGKDLSMSVVPASISGITIYCNGDAFHPALTSVQDVEVSQAASGIVPDRYALSYEQGAVLVMFPCVPPAACTITVDALLPFANLRSLTSDIELPAEYDRLCYLALSIELCPKYGKSVRGDVAALAADAYKSIRYKRATERIVPELQMPAGYPVAHSPLYNIVLDATS